MSEAALALDRAAAILADADALLVAAGAGMGVDSGLPDFRGNEGFWRAYPALGARRLDFASVASPEAFDAEPRLAWGFYGHRLALYRSTVPHDGFARLRAWAPRFAHGLFVFTSNVDGQFQKAGFAPGDVCEVHGSIHHLQCLEPCGGAIWSAAGFDPVVDAARCLLTGPLPQCPDCGGLARPNVLMFGDAGWLPTRTSVQADRLANWLRRAGRVAVIEVGAGTAIPTVRAFGDRFAARRVRINPAAADLSPEQGVWVRLGARAGLAALARTLGWT